MPIALEDLPTVDVVVISHDHYDHLDPGVVRELAPQGVRFAVPLGVGADLEAWGVAADQIIELDWWEGAAVGSLALTANSRQALLGLAGLPTGIAPCGHRGPWWGQNHGSSIAVIPAGSTISRGSVTSTGPSTSRS